MAATTRHVDVIVPRPSTLPLRRTRTVACPACEGLGYTIAFGTTTDRQAVSPPEYRVHCAVCDGDREFVLGALTVGADTEYSDVWYAEGDTDSVRALAAYLGDDWRVSEDDGQIDAPTRLSHDEAARVLADMVRYLGGIMLEVR